MDDVYHLIFEPMFKILAYKITMFGFTFTLFDVVIFSAMVGLLCAIIRFFVGGHSE